MKVARSRKVYSVVNPSATRKSIADNPVSETESDSREGIISGSPIFSPSLRSRISKSRSVNEWPQI